MNSNELVEYAKKYDLTTKYCFNGIESDEGWPQQTGTITISGLCDNLNKFIEVLKC